MIFSQILVGGDRNFSYVLGDKPGGVGVLVDPGFDVRKIEIVLEAHGLRLAAVLNTHSHFDHVDGNPHFMLRGPVPVVLHASTPYPHCSVRAKDGDVLAFGGLRIEVLHTPGHIPDAVCYLVGNKLLTGDTLFVGKVGGTGPGFPGSDPRQEWESLRRLMALPDATEVWPGHNYGVSPSSTIGREKRENPFLLQKTYEDFVHLKDTWLAYKKAHNIG